jgi:type II secretory pathway pseudopilin PulG
LRLLERRQGSSFVGAPCPPRRLRADLGAAPPIRWTGRHRTSAGVALLEVLIALAIAGIALLFLVGLLMQDLRLERRAASQREAFACLEAALAGVRVGALPLVDDHWTESQPPWVQLPSGRGVVLRLQVVPEARELWTVTAQVRYLAWNEPRTLELATRVWRPER